MHLGHEVERAVIARLVTRQLRCKGMCGDLHFLRNDLQLLNLRTVRGRGVLSDLHYDWVQAIRLGGGGICRCKAQR